MKDRRPQRLGRDEDVTSVVQQTTRLYSHIVDWYVDNFFYDLTDEHWLKSLCERLHDGSLVFDVGAGPGNFSRVLQSMGLSVVATDLACPMVAASMRLVPEVPAATADMRHLPFAPGVADGVLCAYSMAHVPSSVTPAVLTEFFRVLRPGGVLQLMVKAGRGSYEFDSTLVPGTRGFVQLWTREEVCLLLADAGFDILGHDVGEASSPHEFSHPKFMILAQRRGRAADGALGRLTGRRPRRLLCPPTS